MAAINSIAPVTVLRNGTSVNSENDSARLKTPLPDENGGYVINFTGQLIAIDNGIFWVVRDSDNALVQVKQTEVSINVVDL